MNDFILVPHSALIQKVYTRLLAAGIAEGQALIEAEIMVEADLMGVPSHGVRMLPGLTVAIAAGHVNKSPTFSLSRSFGAVATLECGNGPGRYAAHQAMQQATLQASVFGVGVCLAKNTTHWGRAHAYASRAATAGFIGICMANAAPTMAIGGAKKPVVGNNPLAIGIPSADPNEPIVLDIAMSQAAVGKVTTWLREGKAVPANWGIDADGQPTQDAQAILGGAVTPMGQHKGAGLAVMIELLTAGLAGGVFTQHLKSLDNSGTHPQSSKLFIALNPAAFIEPADFYQGSAEFIAYLKQQAEPFVYPGERGWATKKEYLQEGVRLHIDIARQLEDIGVFL